MTRLVEHAIANGAEWEVILKGAQNYSVYCGRKQMIGTAYVQMLQTFVGRDWHFEEWASMDLRSPQQIAADQKWQQLESRAQALGYEKLDRARGLSTMEDVIRDLERRRDGEIVRALHIVPKVAGGRT